MATKKRSGTPEPGINLYRAHIDEFLRVYEEDAERAFRRFGFSLLHGLPPAERLEILKKHKWLPMDADDYYNFGTAALKAEDQDEAEKMYKKALSEDPSHANANINMALIMKERGKEDKMREYAQRALENATPEDAAELEVLLGVSSSTTEADAEESPILG